MLSARVFAACRAAGPPSTVTATVLTGAAGVELLELELELELAELDEVAELEALAELEDEAPLATVLVLAVELDPELPPPQADSSRVGSTRRARRCRTLWSPLAQVTGGHTRRQQGGDIDEAGVLAHAGRGVHHQIRPLDGAMAVCGSLRRAVQGRAGA